MYPENVTGNSLQDILSWAYKNGGFNDIYINSGWPAKIKKDGRIELLTENPIEDSVIESMIAQEFGSSTLNDVKSGRPQDPRKDIPHPEIRGQLINFRCNISKIQNPIGGNGISIVIRGIADKVKTPKELGVEDEIIENFINRDGIALVSGPVGSGKSTLVSSLLEYAVNEVLDDWVIETAESPIEYVFKNVRKSNNIISQVSVGLNDDGVRSFSSAVENTLRRGVDGFFLGEMRDLETIEAGLMAANTGKMVWGTLHVNQVGEIPSRIIGVFPPEQRAKIAVEFYSVARLLVCQILVRSCLPGSPRIAVREWLSLTPEMRKQLRQTPLLEQELLLKELVDKHGVTMTSYAEKLLNENKIDYETYEFIRKGS